MPGNHLDSHFRGYQGLTLHISLKPSIGAHTTSKAAALFLCIQDLDQTDSESSGFCLNSGTNFQNLLRLDRAHQFNHEFVQVFWQI